MSLRRLVLEIRGKAKINCDLKLHLSPRTVGGIFRALPLESHVHFLGKSAICLETTLNHGLERSRTEFRRGDVAFLPSSGSICFFLLDMSGKSMTPLGKLADDDALKSVAAGDVLRLYVDAV